MLAILSSENEIKYINPKLAMTGTVTNIDKKAKIDPTEISYLFERLSSLIPKPVDRENAIIAIRGKTKELNPFCHDKTLEP